MKTYADGVGPWKPYLREDGRRRRRAHRRCHARPSTTGASTAAPASIERAHARGLLVHAYTFRNDASGYGFADPKAEMQYYFRLGVDGVFTDFPATGVEAVAGLR